MELIFYKEKGQIKVKCIQNKENEISEYRNINTSDALDIINDLKINSDINYLISNVYYRENSLCFTLDGVKIILNNQKDFIHDNNFKFIFSYIKEKKLKLTRENNVKKMILSISFVGMTLMSVAFVKTFIPKDTNVENDTIIEYSSGSENSGSENTSVEVLIDTILDSSLETEQNTEITETTIKKDDITTKKTNDDKITEKALIETLSSVTVKNDIETIPKTTENSKITYVEENGITNTASSNNEDLDKNIYLSQISIGTLSDNKKVLDVKNNYGSIIEKYCDMYHLDYEIICAVAAQERGEHSDIRDYGGAIGLMQIQLSVWKNPNDFFIVYNYAEGKEEKIYPGRVDLGDLENNIKVGCAIMRMHLDNSMQNQFIALQSYNMGGGSMHSILKTYSNKTGKSIDEIMKNEEDLGWLNYTYGYNGDPNYVEHVMRYYGGDKYLNSKVK